MVCTDYVTKWVEAKTLFSATKHSIVSFLYEDILTLFGVPREIVTDHGSQFTSNLVEKLMEEYKFKHRKSTPYHPQANGKVESTNKVIEGIITKTVHLHKRDWAESLPEALWAYRTTELHGEIQQDILPMNLFMGKKSCSPLSSKSKLSRW